MTFQEDSGTNETKLDFIDTKDQGIMEQAEESNQIIDFELPSTQINSVKIQKIGHKSKVLLNKIRKFR